MKEKEKENRGPLDLTLLVEQHDKEKWELTEQLSKAAEELTILKGTKKLVGDLSVDLVQTKKQLKEAEEINKNHQRYNGKLQTRLTEVEEDNKKLAHQVEDLKLNGVRKAGL